MRAATPPAARLAGLAGLAAFGAWQWGLLVSPGAAGRILLAFAAAAAAAGLIVLGARRGLAARAALTALAALGSVALALLAAGVPAQLLAPANWNELLDGIGQGLEALPGVTVPYTAADPWPRLVILVAGGLLVAFAWAQAWAVYAVLQSPDLFLGGVALERLLELPGAALFAEPWRRTLQAFLLVAGLAAFLASSVALRARLGALDPTGGGEIGSDPGLWAGLFGGAALASLWPVDPWALTLLALGGAGCALGPAALYPPPPGRAALATTAGVVGLLVFATFAAAQLRGTGGALLGTAIGYPALVGAPAGALVLWLGRGRAG
jgi:hypothetical protein